MAFISKNPLSATKMTTPPPAPMTGARGLYPKADGWYDIDDSGAEVKLATISDGVYRNCGNVSELPSSGMVAGNVYNMTTSGSKTFTVNIKNMEGYIKFNRRASDGGLVEFGDNWNKYISATCPFGMSISCVIYGSTQTLSVTINYGINTFSPSIPTYYFKINGSNTSIFMSAYPNGEVPYSNISGVNYTLKWNEGDNILWNGYCWDLFRGYEPTLTYRGFSTISNLPTTNNAGDAYVISDGGTIKISCNYSLFNQYAYSSNRPVGQVIGYIQDVSGSSTLKISEFQPKDRLCGTSLSGGNFILEIDSIDSNSNITSNVIEGSDSDSGYMVKSIEKDVSAGEFVFWNGITWIKPCIYDTSDIIDMKAELQDKADKATTLEGYGITDSYTIDQIDKKFGGYYHNCGSAPALPTSGMVSGDTYNMLTDSKDEVFNIDTSDMTGTFAIKYVYASNLQYLYEVVLPESVQEGLPTVFTINTVVNGKETSMDVQYGYGRVGGYTTTTQMYWFIATRQFLECLVSAGVSVTANLSDTTIPYELKWHKGDNISWTGYKWDNIGGYVDLSDFAKTEDVELLMESVNTALEEIIALEDSYIRGESV